MGFINLTVSFSMIASILERIANALERLVGPINSPPDSSKKRGPESIIQYGNEEREWAKDYFLDLIHKQGHAPEREKSLLKVALKRYDYEKRHQDPNDAEEM